MNNKVKGISKIKPIIIKPACYLKGRKQDCPNCDLFKKDICKSPKGLCHKPYPNHPKGCPNYGKHSMCPPHNLIFDDIFDMEKDIYVIYYAFDIGNHMKKMKEKHPKWSDRQLRNVLYWQGTAKKEHRKIVKEFLDKNPNYEAVVPETLAVDVNKTMKQIGIILKWPPTKYSYRIAIAAIPEAGKTLKNIEQNKHNTLTCFY